MKNLKSYIALVCTVALAASCNNVLDTSPTNLLNDNQVWSSKNAIDAYLGQLYDSMQVEDLEYQIESEGQYLSDGGDIRRLETQTPSSTTSTMLPPLPPKNEKYMRPRHVSAAP